MERLDADLVAYYDQEARSGRRTGHAPYRAELRERFAASILDEGCRSLLDVGAGPGLDTIGFQEAGLATIGLDLGHENLVLMARSGAHGVVGSLYSLPFATGRFDALWTMSTFVHVPHARNHEALTELARVVRPGGLIGVGTWGGFEWEGISDRDDIRPARFFALTTHERWRDTLAAVGTIESFETLHPDPSNNWVYQFATLRV